MMFCFLVVFLFFFEKRESLNGQRFSRVRNGCEVATFCKGHNGLM